MYYRFVLEWLSYKMGIRQKSKSSKRITPHDKEVQRADQKPTKSSNSLVDGALKVPSAPNNSGGSFDIQSHDIVQIYQQQSVENNAALMALSKKLDFICDRLRSIDEDNLVQTEWRAVAMTIDRITFWIFVAISTLTILACGSCAPRYTN